MIISDLSYLEVVFETLSILGGTTPGATPPPPTQTTPITTIQATPIATAVQASAVQSASTDAKVQAVRRPKLASPVPLSP